jgi:acyl-CoA synthetase (AMP-forming)/AMP-acid ligase II
MAIIDYFDRGWRINPQGVAYIQDDTRVTFQEAGEMSCRIANAILAAGYPAGTKGAVWSNNDITAWLCTLGLWRANMTWIPVGARNAPEENLYILDMCDCEIMFFQKYYADAIAALRPQLPKIKRWICIDDDLPDAPSLASWAGVQPSTDPRVNVDPDDVIWLGSTGGTTGKPKGVMNTHRSVQTFVAHFMIGTPYLNNQKPVNMAAAPMTHTAGVLSHGAWRYRGGAEQTRSAVDARLDHAAQGYRVLPAADGNLPPAGYPGSEQEGRFQFAEISVLRCCTDVGGEAQAGAGSTRSGDDGWLRPDRMPRSDCLPATGRALCRWPAGA